MINYEEPEGVGWCSIKRLVSSRYSYNTEKKVLCVGSMLDAYFVRSFALHLFYLDFLKRSKEQFFLTVG